MHAPIERHLAIAGTFNVRDLGGYPVPGGATHWRRILRADGLHRLDGNSIAELKGLGVATVIDLRRDEELETHPNPLRLEPGIDYRQISLFEELAPSAMTAADVLYDLYLQALSSRRDRIVEVLSAIADAPEGIVLFHCTAGKDRTGLIAALLLGLAGVEHDVIVADYALTKERLAPAIEGFVADAVARGVDVEALRPLLACEPETMAATLAHLADRYGSVETYLLDSGLDPATIGRLRARLSEIA
ncbi:tyrosine-protein phosphatase [Mesorhizobium australicum]|uniref:Protein-tyrosine phosphatase n=1 Tax=Mesorhizobium australicum TaxID=536018 RepID=A0A1X7PWC7_9HYPH|nr:tyrosine-protein phosphatase [Mesorhizobium australicum]SMH56388.1 protein-tyrosine phosphatase [Mesorhizobium australicum]